MSDIGLNMDQLLANLPGAGESGGGESTTPQAPTTPAVDDGVELEIAPGKREKFTRAQLVEHYKGTLRQDDYTRKTQALAREREQYEQARPIVEQLYKEHQAMAGLLEDKAKLIEYQRKRWENAPEGSAAETAAETKIASLMQEVNQLKAQMSQAPQRILSQTRQEVETAQLSEKVDAHLKTIFTEKPLLEAIDNAEDILRFKVFQRNPQTLDEARKFFTEEAEGLVKKISEKFTALQQPAQGAGAPVQSPRATGIEPPGGAGAPMPAQASYKDKAGKVDFTKVHDAADQFLRQFKENNR